MGGGGRGSNDGIRLFGYPAIKIEGGDKNLRTAILSEQIARPGRENRPNTVGVG